MSDGPTSGWFHCGRCGALFSAVLSDELPVQCPECGGDPVVGEAEFAFVEASAGKSEGRGRPDGDRASREGRRGSRRSKKRSGAILFVIVWMVFLLISAVAVKWLQGRSDNGSGEGVAISLKSENQRFKEKHFQECFECLSNFLVEVVPESRASHILNGSELLGEMTRFYQEDLLQVDGEKPELKATYFEPIDLPEGKAIESMWLLGGGRKLEVVFRRDETGSWKIDWENTVRHSKYPWPLFLAGVGEDEGEFRLLARIPAGAGAKQGDGSKIVLQSPVPHYPERTGPQSPEIEIDRESRIGRILTKAFELREKEQGAFGSGVVQYDPMNMVRVRVLLRREGDVERRYVIREILACHWLGLDELGLDGE